MVILWKIEKKRLFKAILSDNPKCKEAIGWEEGLF
jgi:hypothetical protein